MKEKSLHFIGAASSAVLIIVALLYRLGYLASDPRVQRLRFYLYMFTATLIMSIYMLYRLFPPMTPTEAGRGKVEPPDN